MSIRATLKVIGNRAARNAVYAAASTSTFVGKCTSRPRQAYRGLRYRVLEARFSTVRYMKEFRNEVLDADEARLATKRRIANEIEEESKQEHIAF